MTDSEGASDPTKVCAVIVSYEPDLAVLRCCIEQIELQVGGVCLVDNTSTPEVALQISQLKGSRRQDNHHKKIHFHCISLGHNQGIASAQNKGIAWAAEQQFEYVLLLDQDSLANPQMVSNQLAAFRQLASEGVVPAAIGAAYIEANSGHSSAFIQFGMPFCKRIYYTPGGANLVRADSLISSGSLISIDTLKAVGEMDESLFIDHVDTEWFLRAAARGFPAYGLWQATMSHALGATSLQFWLGRWYRYPLYPPLRYYYIFRNSLLLWRLPWAPFAWRAFDARRLLRIALLNLLASDQRLPRWRYMWAGIRDGIKARRGEYQSHR